MNKLTEEDIQEINGLVADSWNEGIYTEPTYIPTNIKEPVIYTRWIKSGYKGGNCYDGKTKYFENEKPRFTVLDLALKKIKPEISYLQYKDIDGLIRTNQETEEHYYGNSDDYMVEYIILSELYKLLDV